MTLKKAAVRSETAFLLGSLIEAAGLVQAATGCVLRWGLSGTGPQGSSYRDELLREIDDLKSSIRRVESALSGSDDLPSVADNGR